MARFARGNEHVELVLEDKAIVEVSTFGTVRRDLHDHRAALIAYHKRIAELLAEQWTRTSPFIDDLIATDEPPFPIDDADASAVYRDWLIERGDPRGELAALRAAEAPDARAIASLEKTRGIELFGGFAMLPRAWRAHAELGWRNGWIDEIVLTHVEDSLVQPGELMHAALHAPMARFARWLTVDTFHARTIPGGIAPCSCTDRIIGLRMTEFTLDGTTLDLLPALEELEILDSDRVGGGHPKVWRIKLAVEMGYPDLGPFPSLRRLELAISDSIGLARSLVRVAADLPDLQELAIEAPELSPSLERHIEEMRKRMTVEVTIRPQD